MSRNSKLKRDAKMKHRNQKRIRVKSRPVPNYDNAELMYVDYDQDGAPCRIGFVEMDEGFLELIADNSRI